MPVGTIEEEPPPREPIPPPLPANDEAAVRRALGGRGHHVNMVTALSLLLADQLFVIWQFF